jgi:hypothetical protein
MKQLLLLPLLSICTLSAQEGVRTVDTRLWKTSLAALTVANLVDVRSSWGKHELNPALSGSTGKFGREGALIKLGLQGGLFGVEYLITRGHPTKKVYRALSFINFGAAAATGAVAARNYTIGR